MSYAEVLHNTLAAIDSRLRGLTALDQEAYLLRTVGWGEPYKADMARMPQASLILDKDDVHRKTEFLELHDVSIVVQVMSAVKATNYSDIEITKGMKDGLQVIGSVYDAFVTNRTLETASGKIGNLEVSEVDYMQLAKENSVIFIGEITLKFVIRYNPGKPVFPVMNEVYTKAGEGFR